MCFHLQQKSSTFSAAASTSFGHVVSELSEAEGWIAPPANLEIFRVNFWPIYFQKWPFSRPKNGGQFWAFLGQFLANLFPKMAIFSRQKKEANFGSIFGQFKQENGQLLGQKNGGQFWAFLGQFSANLSQKMANF